MISKPDYALLRLYRTELPYPEKESDHARFDSLCHRGLIEGTQLDTCAQPGVTQVFCSFYRVTPAGEDALSEFEERAAEQAERKRQQRFDNKISVLSVLVPLGTFLLGVYVEYRLALVEVIVRIVP